MISIGRISERPQRPPAGDLAGCLSQLRRLLQEGIGNRQHWFREATTPEFELTVRDLLRRLEDRSSPLDAALVATAALEAFEDHARHAAEHFHEQGSQMHAMLAMLTETIAEISAHSDASVARLHSVEQQIERASSLDDLRALKESLAVCLAAVKEAAQHQKSASQAAVERLHGQLHSALRPAGHPPASVPAEGASYVVVFKLQRADHILTRFGQATADQMLAMIGEVLQASLGSRDRLERWKNSSFLLFLDSNDAVPAIRRRVSGIVARIGQRYVEVGKNSALLAVGVDWILFPHAQYPSPDAIFAEADSFVEKKSV